MPSTFTLPASWTLGAARTLGDAMTLVMAVPAGKTIYFNELQPETSMRNARLSDHVGSAAQMSFIVNQEALEDTTLRIILTKSILGGYCTLNSKKNAPYKHPYLPGMFAKDIIECVPFETQDATTAQAWGNYNLCKITISFESLNYPVNETNNLTLAPYNTNWVEYKWTSSSNRVSIPTGWYRFTTGAFSPLPSSYGTWLVAPYTNLQMTIYQCTRAMVFGLGADAYNLKIYGSQFVGLCNQSAFAGLAAESLLLDSIEVNPFQDWLGDKYYNVRLNWIYNEKTWNKAPDPGGSWESIKYVLGAGKPFETFLAAAFIQTLNPF